MLPIEILADQHLTPQEQAKREGLMARKPYVAKKLANISAMEERGEISPIIRLEKKLFVQFSMYPLLCRILHG